MQMNWGPLLTVNGQTRLKTLPSRNLRMRAFKILNQQNKNQLCEFYSNSNVPQRVLLSKCLRYVQWYHYRLFMQLLLLRRNHTTMRQQQLSQRSLRTRRIPVRSTRYNTWRPWRKYTQFWNFLQFFWGLKSFSQGLLIPLFLTSSVCPGFQSQGDSLLAFSTMCNGFLRFTSGATSANCVVVIWTDNS